MEYQQGYSESDSLQSGHVWRQLERCTSEEIFASRLSHRRGEEFKMTPESLKNAALVYDFSSYEVKRIIDSYSVHDARREMGTHRVVLENNDLRINLGGYLLDRLDRLAETDYLPDRLMDNTEKEINYAGYHKVLSREAAVLIAISMLDGTFEPERSRLDPIEVALVERGHAVATQGQHRWAALQALEVSEHDANVLDIGVEYAS